MLSIHDFFTFSTYKWASSSLRARHTTAARSTLKETNRH